MRDTLKQVVKNTICIECKLPHDESGVRSEERRVGKEC